MSTNENGKEFGSVELRKAEIKEIANKAMDDKFKGWKRTASIFGICFILVMAVVVAIGVLYMADLAKTLADLSSMTASSETATITIERNGLLSADYLAAVIPLLLALGGSFIAFLGMNRLKMFDERIDQTRSEMLKEIEARVKSEVAVDRVEFSNQVLQGIGDEQKKFSTMVEKAEDALSERKERCIDEIKTKFDAFEQKYAWLEATVTDREADLSFHTIDDAHKLVEQLRNEKPNGYIDIIKKIIDRVCSGEEMSGDSADYHNLAAELARGSMYNEACKVLREGLKLFENDTDIHSDIIEYATKGGMLKDAKESVQKLEGLTPRIWTWRCYEFICDYYRAIGNLEKANDLCTEFIDTLPNDEHGYRSKAEILRLLHPGDKGTNEAISILKCAIERNINCPQCANELAKIYLSIGEYEKALKAINRAILDLAQEQPHVPISYVFYTRANIQDRLFMQKMEQGHLDQHLVDSAYVDYRMALALNLQALSPIIAQQAKIRMLILNRYTTSDDTTIGDAEELLSLLQSTLSEIDGNTSD